MTRWTRTKASLFTLATILLTLLVSQSTAMAQSAIHGNAELKLGGYYPAIDDSYSGTGPYETFFGKDWRFHGELEWDIYFLQSVLPVGKLGVGFHIGYSSATGSVQIATENATAASDDIGETSFTTIPLRVSLLYRYDYSAIHHGIPLVPALKVGLDYVFWDVEDSNGETATYQGVAAQGGKFGYHAAFALHLLLDVIDENSAAYMDMSWGVNNSYFFAEYMLVRVDDFGGGGLDLSDNMWMFGLAFEF